jgi:tetratricopeptide (TPR) repeat protein
LLGHLGVEGEPGSPSLPELAAVGRAIGWIEKKKLRRAWREVAGGLTPASVRLRDHLLQLARSEKTPLPERARVLTAAGHSKTGWELIAKQAERQGRARKPDRAILLAAAEVETTRGRPREALAYLERLLELDPSNAEALYAYGELLLAQGRIPEARTAFTKAARAEGPPAAALPRLAGFRTGDPKERARTLVQAAESETRHWNLENADRLAREAARISPALALDAHSARARANETAGRVPEALSAWRDAAKAGGEEVDVWVGIGRAESALGQPGAEQSFRRALAIAPQNPDALAGLGQVVLEQGRSEEALPLLRQAVEVAPRRPDARLALAIALSQTGKDEEALGVLDAAPSALPPDAEALTLAAAIQRRSGDPDAALAALESAARLNPYDSALQRELASLYAAKGNSALAARARALSGALAAGDRAPRAEGWLERGVGEAGFDGLVGAFANQFTGSRRRTVAFLGARESRGWMARVRQWLDPRAPDLAYFEGELRRALSHHFELVTPRLPDSPLYEKHLNRVYDFVRPDSASAESIAFLNEVLGTDAIFVAQIAFGARVPEGVSVPTACASRKRLELHARMLSGALPEYVSIFHDRECFEGGLDDHGIWNRRAMPIYGALLLLLLFPVLRGWGSIVVDIKLPARTKGFLSIKIGNQPLPVGVVIKEGRIRQLLNQISRYRKPMAGRRTAFRWIPARRREYYVSVSGPFLDSQTQEIIGDCIEEQLVRVRRGKAKRVTFDMAPSKCAVHVTVLWNNAPARSARVSLRNQPGSLKYARDGSVFFYLNKGKYAVCVGALDRAREFPFEVESLERSVPIVIDLGEDSDLQVINSEEAVEPFLHGDFGAAAEALAAAGESQLAHRLRGAHFKQKGDAVAAAAEFQAAGDNDQAGELLASSTDHGAAAQLFENAGEWSRAADSHRAAGNLEDAARCYTAAYDYDNALECYDAVGDVENVIATHEKTGSFLEAAELSKQYGNLKRALRNLEEVGKRDLRFGEACQLAAEILAERGTFDVAAERMAQAIQVAGGESANPDLHERHAELLHLAGDLEGAVAACEQVRRLDPARDNVEETLEALRAKLEEKRKASAPPARSENKESRYEIVGELGRGAMGVVYKARDRRLNRIVALKRLSGNLRENKTAAQLFLREAQAAAALNHRNIVTLYDAGEENGVYHITMELLEGLPLSAIQEQRGAFSVRDTAGLGLQVCAGLHYAHSQRIVHRDIKPGNIFFTRERVVKIMDFGLAKTIEEVRKGSTVIGGTPYYMAPEQALGQAVDNRTDLYAFGVTLFRMLTNTFPFTEGDLAYHHRHTAPPDPREHVPQLPEAMARLVLDLLQKDPGARPATAADVAARLQAIGRAARAPSSS